MNRSAGILLPITSLPSPYGIGCFDSMAYRFVDWLADAGQAYWQILPLGPTGYGNSPYQSFSTFAGNPYLISLETFIADGLLTRAACEASHLQTLDNRVDYQKQYTNRYPLLRMAYESSDVLNDPAFSEFCRQNPWLEVYALFTALKEAHHGAPWNEWESELRLREPSAMEESREKYRDEINFCKFLQYHFYRQWYKLKAYANERGIQIIGDIPIYVAYDSADTWANPELFQLDSHKNPIAVAGCPPDGFSPDGQLWGNPLYDWDAHRATGFEWWISRLSHCYRLYDAVRIDHFRGFDEYYAIPYGDRTAHNGHWEKGPGMELFHKVRESLGQRDVIAEDLGFMTDSVRQLVRDSGFPNMKVLEFAFDARDTGSANEHLPHNYGENCVAYTGTHDNQTLISWYQTITDAERHRVRDYLGNHHTPDHELNKHLIRAVMESKARLCIIPMQDWLGLDDRSRMNIPSTVGDNWKWRMVAGDMSPELGQEIRRMTHHCNR